MKALRTYFQDASRLLLVLLSGTGTSGSRSRRVLDLYTLFAYFKSGRGLSAWVLWSEDVILTLFRLKNIVIF